MKLKVIKAYVDDGRYAPLLLPHTVVQCHHGDHPHRRPYGEVLYRAWIDHSTEVGIVWVESDIAIEPLHLSEIETEVAFDPNCVVAVPFRLYPASTHREDVTWPFYVTARDCSERILQDHEAIPHEVRSFGLGCTYLPSRLLLELGERITDWDWPSLDWRLSIAARDSGYVIKTTHTPAVHLHY